MTKNDASIASTFQITWILKIDSEKGIILHIHPGFNVFDLKFMFFENLVAVFQTVLLCYFHNCC